MRWWHILLRPFATLQADTADRCGAALGLLVWASGLRRRVVSGNIARSLGLGGPVRGRIARRAYASLGANVVLLLSAPRLAQDLERRVTILNPGWCRHLAATTPGCIMLTLHLGCWDVAGAMVKRLFGAAQVMAKRQRQGEEMINTLRQTLGMQVVYAGDRDRQGPVQILRGLRRGIPAGLLADQGARPPTGIAAWFLGQPCWCHAGPGFLAGRGGAPLVPGFALRRAAGRYVGLLGRPLTIRPEQQERATQYGLDILSALIAAFPGQYFWHHDRFKRSPVLPPRPRHPWQDQGLGLLNAAHLPEERVP